MSKINWYMNRLKAMSVQEVLWRMQQKSLCCIEKSIYTKADRLITKDIYFKSIPDLRITAFKKNNYAICDTGKCQIFYEEITLNDSINWHKGFTTQNSWDKTFSYDLKYKQNDKMGDARTNWELNRLFFLPQIAKNYYVSRDKKYIVQFKQLFYNWVNENPFLKGISWTSVMEVAIRAYQWYVSLVFLVISDTGEEQRMLEDLKTGTLNMMEYVNRHYSRFSSANNHLVVEMAILGIIGQSFGISKWVDLSVTTLEAEIERQNFEDGVNREQSIHYQTFVMEAVALLLHMLKENNIGHSPGLENMLKAMCRFIADMSDIRGEISHIGDNDEGKLLDLCGYRFNHYRYVLQLCSVLLDMDFAPFDKVNDNLLFLFDNELIHKKRQKYDNGKSKCYRQGGHTVLKHGEGREERLMTFDHAELGFGKIAAHGHSDSLNITLSVDGEQIIIDPGTYIYHTEIDWRNYFRRTINHNTVAVNDRDQSEMQGAFLWGSRAETCLESFESSTAGERVAARHDGYKPVIHRREIRYCKPDLFIVLDYFENSTSDYFTATFCLNSGLSVLNEQDNLAVGNDKVKLFISCSHEMELEECWISKLYGVKEKSRAIKIRGNTRTASRLVTCISIGSKHVFQGNSVLFNGTEYFINV